MPDDQWLDDGYDPGGHGGLRYRNLTDGSTTVEVIPPDDTHQIQVGAMVSGAGGLPSGIVTVASVVDSQTFTLSAAATADGGPLALDIEVGANTSVLAVGESVSGPGVPAGATVANDPELDEFELSVAAAQTSSTVGVTLTFGEPLYLTFSDGDPNGAAGREGRPSTSRTIRSRASRSRFRPTTGRKPFTSTRST